jgi:hypothetical protein
MKRIVYRILRRPDARQRIPTVKWHDWPIAPKRELSQNSICAPTASIRGQYTRLRFIGRYRPGSILPIP